MDARSRSSCALDVVAYRALRAGAPEVVKRMFLGPEIENFEAMARRPRPWRATRAGSARGREKAFDEERDASRKRCSWSPWAPDW